MSARDLKKLWGLLLYENFAGNWSMRGLLFVNPLAPAISETG